MKSIFHTKISFKDKLIGVILVDPLKGVLTAIALKVKRYTETCKQNLTYKTTNFFSKNKNSK